MLSALEFLIDEVRIDLRRGGIVRGAPIVIIAVTLFVLGMFLVVTVNLRKGILVAQEKVQMVVFASDESVEAIETLRDGLSQIPGVRDARFVSREEALERFRRDLGDKRELLEAVESNPLPASFELAIFDDFKSAEQMAAIAAAAESLPSVEGVRYGEDWVGRLERLIVFSVLLDLFLGILLGISTILSVANTLKLALRERRDAIEVMRLVGASDNAIRGPVFTEGALLGILASALAAAALYACYALLTGRIPELAFLGPPTLAAFLATGALLGGLGGLLALERILKEPVGR
jgi:cell division transport system permease protein